MATVLEQAVVELQIVVREMHRRLSGIERRLGLEHEPWQLGAQRPRPMTPLPLQDRRNPVVTRTAPGHVDPYDMAEDAAASGGAGTATLEPPAIGGPPPGGGGGEPFKVELSETGGGGANMPAAAEAKVRADSVSNPPEKIAESSEQPARDVGPAEPGVGGEIPVAPPPPPAPLPPAARKVMEFMARQPEPAPAGPGIEATLGMTAASWAGALAIIGSVVFFLTYAFDGRPSLLVPMLRVGLSAGAGAGLMALGLWFHRRRFRSLSLALCGSGLACVMASLFAANLAYVPPVLSRATVMLAVAGAAAMGVGVALLAGAQVLAALAVLGAFLSPFLLNPARNHLPETLAYLLVLSLGTLALAAVKRSWESVRVVAFVMAWVWLIGGAGDPASSSHVALGIAFVYGFFVLFLGDAMLGLQRSLAQDPAQGSPMTVRARYMESSAAVYSFLNSGAALLAGWLLFVDAGLPNLWLFPLTLSALMFLASRAMASEPFRLSATTQSVLLLLAAIPLYFNDQGATFGYAIGALAFAVYARQAQSQFARVWMFVMLAVAAARVITQDAFDANAQYVLFAIDRTQFTDWMVAGWALAIEALALAWLCRPEKAPGPDGTTQLLGARWAVIACITVATALVLVIDVWTLDREGAFTLAALLWVFAILLLARVPAFRDMAVGLESFAAGMLMLVCMKWMAYDGLAREALDPVWQTWPILNLYTLNALLIALGVLLLRFSSIPAWGEENPRASRRFYGWWLFAIGFVLANMQALRAVDYFMQSAIAGIGSPELAKNAALTLVWSLTGAGLVMVGFGWKAASVRYVGLALLALTLAKILFLDTAGADTALRVLSFLLVSVLLFLVSYWYHQWQGAARPSETRS